MAGERNVMQILNDASFTMELPSDETQAIHNNIDHLRTLYQGQVDLLLAQMANHQEIFQNDFLTRHRIEPTTFHKALKDHVTLQVGAVCYAIEPFLEAPTLKPTDRENLQRLITRLEQVKVNLIRINPKLLDDETIQPLIESLNEALTNGNARLEKTDEITPTDQAPIVKQPVREKVNSLAGDILARFRRKQGEQPARVEKPVLGVDQVEEPKTDDTQPKITEQEQTLIDTVLSQKDIASLYLLVSQDKGRSDYQKVIRGNKDVQTQIMVAINSQVDDIYEQARRSIDSSLPSRNHRNTETDASTVYYEVDTRLGISNIIDRLKQLQELVGVDTTKKQQELRGIRTFAYSRISTEKFN